MSESVALAGPEVDEAGASAAAPVPAVGPALSIVVVTRGPSLALARLLRSLGRARAIETTELILGIDDARSHQVELVERAARRWLRARLRVVPLPKDHPGQNRNSLVLHARAPVVVFLDDDVTIPDGFLEAARDALADEGVGVAGGPNLTPLASPPFEELSGRVLASAAATGPVRHRYRSWRPGPATERSLTLCNLVVRRHLLEPSPFDADLKCAEENELLLRLARGGIRMAYVPELAVYHHRRESVAAYGRQMAKYGFGRGQLLARAFYAKQTTYALPLLVLCVLVAALAFAPKVGLVALALYAAAVLAAGFVIGGPRRGPLAASLVGLTHGGYTAGLVAGLAYEVHRLQRRVLRASEGRFGRDAALTFVALGLAIGGGVASGIVIARGLGPHGRGTFELVRTITGVAAMSAGFGLGRAAVFLRPRDELDDRQMFGVVCSTVLPGTVIGVVTGLVMSATGWLTLGQVNLWLMCLTIPLITFFYNGQAALQGLQRQAWFRRTLGLRDGLFLVFVAIAVGFQATMRVVLIAWIAHWVVSAALMAYLLYERCGRPALPAGRWRRLAGVGLSQLVMGLILQAHMRLDVVVLDIVRGPTALGHYAVAVGAAEPIAYGGVAVAVALYPRSATSSARKAAGGGVRTARSLRAVLAVTFAAAAVLWVVGPRLLEALFGARFAAAGTPLRALLPGIVGMTMFFVLTSDLGGRGKIKTIALVSVGSTIANLLLNLVLDRPYGPTGAAIASTITYWLAALVVLVIFARSTGIPMLRCIIPRPRDARKVAAAFFGRRSDALVG